MFKELDTRSKNFFALTPSLSKSLTNLKSKKFKFTEENLSNDDDS